MSAEAAAQPPATGGTPAEGDTGAVPVNSYYLPDNTWVQVMSDGVVMLVAPRALREGEAVEFSYGADDEAMRIVG